MENSLGHAPSTALCSFYGPLAAAAAAAAGTFDGLFSKLALVRLLSLLLFAPQYCATSKHGVFTTAGKLEFG